MTQFRPSSVAILAAAFVAAAGLFISSPAVAQQAALKVGVFDKQRLVDESKLGLVAKARFEKVQAERENEVNSKQKAFETLQAAFTQKAQVLSEDKKLDLQRDLARASDEWKSSASNAERDLQRAYQSALMDLLSKIEPIVAAYGKAESFDLLFDKEQCAFNREALEVTEALIAKLNTAHPE